MKTPHPPRRLTALAAAAAALVAASALTAPAAIAAPEPAQPTSIDIDLDGTWKFLAGDDKPAYAQPDFDDSSWGTIEVPTLDGKPFDTIDGYGWYRLDFALPAEAKGTNLIASLGFLDDVDEAYLNGVRIGGSGTFPTAPGSGAGASSQWFEKRLYPVPADAPNFGGENTLAVRMYDMNGGGGWYQGPVGIFSKDVVRSDVYGIDGEPASANQVAKVRAVLEMQREALKDGDADGYLATLSKTYFHDGRDLDRRSREVNKWIDESGSLTLHDGEIEVIRAADGTLIVDTNRTVTGTRDGKSFEFQPTAQQFLRFDPITMRETGNNSRFFRETVDSKLEGQPREFVTYLPPSYLTDPTREYPIVYMLHGINGGSREWEPRDMDAKLDELWSKNGLAESIVVFPDGESLWYVDSPAVPWRSMFLNEMMPLVESEYRVLAEADFRGLSGVSMGGFGTYSIGLNHPELFSSLASHIGALSFAQGGFATPLVEASNRTKEQLDHYSLYFDACESDEYRFDNAARTMAQTLDAKGVKYTSFVGEPGNHNDACWVPHLPDAFGSHSKHFRAAGLVEQGTPSTPIDVSDEQPTLTVDDDLVAGEKVTVSGERFFPGEALRVELRSAASDTMRAAAVLDEPVTLADVTVDEDGTFSASITLPADLDAGDYTIAVAGVDGDLASIAVTIAAAPVVEEPTEPTNPTDPTTPTTPGDPDGSGAAPGSDDESTGGAGEGDLATTGADSTPLIASAALLLLAGAGILLLRRRRLAA